jgi:hypothetical protein
MRHVPPRRPRSHLLRKYTWMMRLRCEDKSYGPSLLAWESHRLRLPNKIPCPRREEKSRRTCWVPIQMLEFDSIRPPWHKSNYPSLFQVWVRGLELEKVSESFCPGAINWSRSVECTRPTKPSSSGYNLFWWKRQLDALLTRWHSHT